MTHKLATWIDQFGTSGCVGCGRCITWCPVAIDITEEAAAIRATDLGAEQEGGRCRRLTSCSPSTTCFARPGDEHLDADRGLRARTAASTTATYLLREGEPAERVLRHPPRAVALETYVPQRGAMTIETLHDGDLLGWSWLVPAVPHRRSTRARSATCARSPSTAPACAASATRTRCSATS